MDIINKPIDELKGYDKNARLHSKDQIEEIAQSIKNFGFNDPIEVGEDNVIISGHARLAAAQSLGLTEVPTIIHKHMDETHRKAYVLAANRIAMSSTWDSKLLSEEMLDLHQNEFDLRLTGFTGEEINEILNPEEINDSLIDEDECGEEDKKNKNKCPSCGHEY
jgi:ParB-like chromosome segregation protein Spo0J